MRAATASGASAIGSEAGAGGGEGGGGLGHPAVRVHVVEEGHPIVDGRGRGRGRCGGSRRRLREVVEELVAVHRGKRRGGGGGGDDGVCRGRLGFRGRPGLLGLGLGLRQLLGDERLAEVEVLEELRRASSSKRIPRKPHVSSSSLAAVAVASLFLVSQNVLSASLPPVDTAPSSSADTSASTAVETFIRVSAVPDGFSAAAGSSAPPFGLTPKPTSCPPKPKVAPHGLLIHAGAFFIGAFGPGC